MTSTSFLFFMATIKAMLDKGVMTREDILKQFYPLMADVPKGMKVDFFDQEIMKMLGIKKDSLCMHVLRDAMENPKRHTDFDGDVNIIKSMSSYIATMGKDVDL